jgi:hypothetical protein
MARPLRIEYPGAIYHVLSRGDRREAIFRAEADRKLSLEIRPDLPADRVADSRLLSDG